MVKEPEDWERKTVGDCSLILQGGTPSTLIGKYWDGDVTWVTPSDISRLTGMWITNSERNLSPAGIAHSSAVILPEKTILLCTRATIGALALTTRPMATNQGFKNLVCKPGVDPVFLAYLLTTKTDEMKALSVGTTFLELSKKNLSEIPLRVPPHSEQRAIAEVLSEFDEHLANLDQLIVKKKAIRDGALDNLVNARTRLPGFSEEWKYVALGDTSSIRGRIGFRGYNKSDLVSETAAGATVVLGGVNISRFGNIELNQLTYLSFEKFLESPEIALQDQDLLITKVGAGVGDVSIYQRQFCRATINPNIVLLRMTDNHCAKFFLYKLLSLNSQSRLKDEGRSSGAQPAINQGFLGRFRVKIPIDFSEQKAIADVLSSMDDEIRVLQSERAKVEHLKLGAMDDLLTGRVRLTIEEEVA